MTTDTQAAPEQTNPLVDTIETTFHFRKVTDAKTKVETKRPSVILPLPVPSVEGIIAIIQAGGKQLELLQDAVRSIVVDQAREHVSDNLDCTPENFPYASLTWDAIANVPQAERKGGGISKELWEAFGKDYMAIMPAIINKSPEACENAVKLLLAKFQPCRSNKPVLNMLKGYLAIYINHTANGEEFAEPVDWLLKKADVMIQTGDENLMNSL